MSDAIPKPSNDAWTVSFEAAIIIFIIGIIMGYQLRQSLLLSVLKPPPFTPVQVTVARFPANGAAPSLERLETTTYSLIEETHVISPSHMLFPSHMPNVWKFWRLPPNMFAYRDWEATELKNQYTYSLNGVYVTFYSFAESKLQENHHVPKIFQPGSRTFGDVFVAKLGRYQQCGKHGKAVYEDIPRCFFDNPNSPFFVRERE